MTVIEVLTRPCMKIESQGIKFNSFQVNTDRQMSKVRNLVENVLASNQVARNSDSWLLFLAWFSENKIKLETLDNIQGFFIPLTQVKNLTVAESITRLRRLLNHKYNKYLPTDPSVVAKRKILSQEFTNYFHNLNKKEDKKYN